MRWGDLSSLRGLRHPWVPLTPSGCRGSTRCCRAQQQLRSHPMAPWLLSRGQLSPKSQHQWAEPAGHFVALHKMWGRMEPQVASEKQRKTEKRGKNREIPELKALADQLSTEGLGGFALYSVVYGFIDLL